MGILNKHNNTHTHEGEIILLYTQQYVDIVAACGERFVLVCVWPCALHLMATPFGGNGYFARLHK